jgi:hypothetical protein
LRREYFQSEDTLYFTGGESDRRSVFPPGIMVDNSLGSRAAAYLY